MLRTRFSIGERLSEGRERSLSSVNWFCKEAKYCACSHSEKCWPSALEESLEACSFKRAERLLCVMPIYVLPQPGHSTKSKNYNILASRNTKPYILCIMMKMEKTRNTGGN